jgi:hypothetical protein
MYTTETSVDVIMCNFKRATCESEAVAEDKRVYPEDLGAMKTLGLNGSC